jgi:predicted O-methyltransferase YrrM
MPIDYNEAQNYIATLSQTNDPTLLRMEEEARRDRFPIIGPAGGRLLYLIARMIGARKVFELGSGYGYSTLWLAKAVRENGGGVVHHTVWDEGLHRRAKDNIEEAGYSDLTQFHLGEAVQALRETDDVFDLFFNDIDKHGYPDSLPVMKEKLRVGGAIAIDNMLLHGSVYDPEATGRNVEGAREFTRLLKEDPDFAFQLVPIRDGIIVAVRLQ